MARASGELAPPYFWARYMRIAWHIVFDMCVCVYMYIEGEI